MTALMRAYFAWAARTPVLLGALIWSLITVLLLFPALSLAAPLLDVRDGYSHAELMDAMAQYGASGRRIYAWASPTIDTLFPMAYVTLFSGILYRLRPFEWLWVAAWIPVLAGLWDLCENAQITAMLLMFPAVSERQVAWASFFAHVKNAYIGPAYQLPAMAFLVIAFLQYLVRARNTR